MRYAPVAMALMALCFGTLAFGGANPNFTLVMHGIHPATFTETCTTPTFNCDTSRPTVNLPAGAVGPGALYLYVANHTALAGVQTAFAFAPWTIIFGNWTCQTNQLSLAVPANPGGPVSGLVNTAFNCVNNPAVAVIGFMTMNLSGSGCVTQVQPENSTFQALDCNLELDEFEAAGNESRLGSVCIGQGGVDACQAIIPVESATWGSIKAQYK